MSDVGRAVIEMPESEDSLRGEAQRSRSGLDRISIAVLIFDCDLVLRQINRCALEGIGAHLEHAIGRSLHAILADRYDSETCASLVAHFERTLRTGVAYRQREWSLGKKKKDPEDRFIDWEIQQLQRPDGSPDGVLLSATDVTNQVLVRRELEQVSKRYQAFADGLPQLAYTVQPDGGLDYVNRLWRSYTGLDLERTRGSGWRAAIHPDDLPPTDAGWDRARAIGCPFELEQRIRAFDGAYRWHLTRCWPVRGENGDIVQWIGTCTDIHHKRAHEEAIRQANSELQQFAYVASHDLQEPLRMVTGYLSLLQRRCSASLDEAAKEYVGFAFDGATRMQKLILHLLDFARVGQGSL
nr:PAS domain-containing protein [Planctomycetota bacterium]